MSDYAALASIPAEQGVIGSLVLAAEKAWPSVEGVLAEGDFSRRDHQLIFRVIHEMAGRGEVVDAITLSTALEARGWLAECGGLAYLASLAKETPSAANTASYASIVLEHSIRRELVAVGREVADMGAGGQGRSVAELLEASGKALARVSQRGARGGDWVDMSGVMARSIEVIYAAAERGTAMVGASTGLKQLDADTSGLRGGDLVVIAARPSMGKTSLGMQLAREASRTLPVAVFSMEMPVEQLGVRLLSSDARIDSKRLRTGQLEEYEWPRLTAAMTGLSDAQLFIDESPALSPAEISARARLLVRKVGPLGMILVDYLQLMQIPGMERDPVAMVSACSAALKALAKEMDCPLVALSQLNRSLENRPSKRPVMADIRQSGAVEQDADLILFIYRDEVYNKETEDKGVAEIIIGKQRNGPIGTVKTAFIPEYTRFEDLAFQGDMGGNYGY